MKLDDQYFDSLVKQLDQSEGKADKASLWEGIEARLDERKKRIVFPFWLIGTAAAILVLLTLFISNQYNSANFIQHEIELAEKKSNYSNKTQTIPDKSSFTTSSVDEKSFTNEIKIEKENFNRTNDSQFASNNLDTEKAIINQTKQVYIQSKENTRLKEVQLNLDKKNVLSVQSNNHLSYNEIKPQLQVRLNQLHTREQLPKTEQESSPKTKRWFAGGNFSPDVSNIELKNEELRHSTGNISQPEFKSAFSTGVDIGYQIASKWSMRSGVNYANWVGDSESELNRKTFTFDNDYNNSGEKIVSISEGIAVDSIQTDFRMQMIQLPISFRYKVIDRKIKGFVSSGVQSNWFVDYKQQRNGNSKHIYNMYQSNQDETQPTNNIQMQMLFSVGFEYPFATVFSFHLEPEYRLGIYQSKSSVLKQPASSMGLRTGISIKF